jgi:DNA-binding transcriptional LysR family regulator
MRDKIAAQVAGLGCGYLAMGLIGEHIASGRLVPKLTTAPRLEGAMYYASSSSARGRALSWFLNELESGAVRNALLSSAR